MSGLMIPKLHKLYRYINHFIIPRTINSNNNNQNHHDLFLTVPNACPSDAISVINAVAICHHQPILPYDIGRYNPSPLT